MNVVCERIEALKSLMRRDGIDAYLIPSADVHGSEYIADHFKAREFMTGFTGSAGTAVVTESETCLWTDGRYFIQAGEELSGSGIRLMRMGEEGVPEIPEYLEEKLPWGGTVAFDGRVMAARKVKRLKDALFHKQVSFLISKDLVGEIWKERPPLQSKPAWVLPVCFSGKTIQEKLAAVRGQMKKFHADAHLITCLDDIAWLLNIRGDDIPCNPVVFAYLLLTEKEALLYADARAFEGEGSGAGEDVCVREYLENAGVRLRPYEEVYEAAGSLVGRSVLLDTGCVNSELVRRIKNVGRVIDHMNPATEMKAVKNPVEIENIKKAHIKDGTAVSAFLFWLKTNIGKIPMDELGAAAYLEELRRQQEGYLGPSFDTISAYGAHAAMCHYQAGAESNVPLEAKGFYLVDSGGQYFEGTTDITRTVALGPLTKEQKEHFTLVLISMLRLGGARFLSGTSGQGLDYAARQVLWQRGLNFDHGTGHGVGYLLNVHEGPNNIRYRASREGGATFKAGMVTSDEPGLYIEGKYGIRTENLVLCVEDGKTDFGSFLRFEYLTYAPIDRDAIEPSLMEERDIRLLNEYHRRVYEKIGPRLEGEARKWLKEVTRPL